MFLDLNALPEFCFSHYRRFLPGEKHINRRCKEDVIVFVFSGVLRFTENGAAQEIGPGEYYIQQRGLEQLGPVESDQPYYYYIHFQGSWNEERGIRVHGNFAAETARIVQRLDELCAMNASLLERTTAFYQLLCLLPFAQPDLPRSRLAEQIRTRLNASVQSGISLSSLADELHFSPNYIIRVFKDAYSQTPMEYLLHLRIEKAEKLIRYSGMPLSAIAQECGFGNYVNLYKAFRKLRRTAPGDMRK